MDVEELIRTVASKAAVACQSEFATSDGQGRDMKPEERSVSQQAALLAVMWTATQPVSRFVFDDGTFPGGVLGSREERRQRREEKQKQKQAWREDKRRLNNAIDDCRAWVESNWEEFEQVVGAAVEDTFVSAHAELEEFKSQLRADGVDEEGVGFILALIGAIAWYTIIALVVRWLVRTYFDEPELPRQICIAG